MINQTVDTAGLFVYKESGMTTTLSINDLQELETNILDLNASEIQLKAEIFRLNKEIENFKFNQHKLNKMIKNLK